MFTRSRLVPIRPVLSIALVLAASLLFGACATPASPTFGTVSAAGLAGTWKLKIVQRTGGPAIATPSDAVYTLTVLDGSTLSARADCNTCTGSFSIVGDVITVSPVLACTRALCPTSTIETIYESLLAGENRIGVLEQTMVLNSARGQLRFTR